MNLRRKKQKYNAANRKKKRLLTKVLQLCLILISALLKPKSIDCVLSWDKRKRKKPKQKVARVLKKLYVSTWAHYNRLAFLLPVMGHSESRETLRKKKDIELENDGNNNDDDIGESPVHIPKTRSIAERKLDLLTKCTEAITTKKTRRAIGERTESLTVLVVC